tara:strand:- start:5 stop:262 length:258 start_codon:yes stop_codon:yes gene_type:complete
MGRGVLDKPTMIQLKPTRIITHVDRVKEDGELPEPLAIMEAMSYMVGCDCCYWLSKVVKGIKNEEYAIAYKVIRIKIKKNNQKIR